MEIGLTMLIMCIKAWSASYSNLKDFKIIESEEISNLDKDSEGFLDKNIKVSQNL